MFGAGAAYDLACRLEEFGVESARSRASRSEANWGAAEGSVLNLKQAVVELEAELSKFIVEPVALGHP